MSLEMISGLIGGWFGTIIGKFIGKFKLWKVFVLSIVLIYLALYVFGAYFVGLRQSFLEMSQYFRPKGILIFFGIAAGVTFVAFLGRCGIQKDVDRKD